MHIHTASRPWVHLQLHVMHRKRAATERKSNNKSLLLSPQLGGAVYPVRFCCQTEYYSQLSAGINCNDGFQTECHHANWFSLASISLLDDCQCMCSTSPSWNRLGNAFGALIWQESCAIYWFQKLCLMRRFCHECLSNSIPQNMELNICNYVGELQMCNPTAHMMFCK